MTLAIYEKALPPGLSWRQKLDAAAKAGFDAMELSVDESDEKLARLEMPYGLRRALLDFEHDAGVRIGSICLSGHRKYPLGSPDASTRKRGMDIMRGAIKFAESMGINLIQLAGYDTYYEASTPDTPKYFEENLRTAVDYTAGTGVILAFETMETSFMNTTAKAMNYVSRVNSPCLGVYPDIGNLTNGVEPEGGCGVPGGLAELVASDLELGRGHIFAAHLKETRPGVFRDLFPGEGRVDFASAVKKLADLGVRRFTAEQWYRDDRASVWEEDLRRTADYLRGVWSSR
jgi:Putative L-xylulose-5-phosphate 3-epimerase